MSLYDAAVGQLSWAARLSAERLSRATGWSVDAPIRYWVGTVPWASSRQVGALEGVGAYVWSSVCRGIAAFVRGCLALSGIEPNDLRFPPHTPARSYWVDVPLRCLQFGGRWLKVFFYPEIFFRSVLFGVCLRATYVCAAAGVRRFRLWQYSRRVRKQGGLEDPYEVLKSFRNARTINEFRNAEKALNALRFDRELAFSVEEKRLLAKCERRFNRYRDYVRSCDLRSLQFELRNDLLRKHFGGEVRHPLVKDAINRYSGIVCCSFALIASGMIPVPLQGLVDFGRESSSSSSSSSHAHRDFSVSLGDELESYWEQKQLKVKGEKPENDEDKAAAEEGTQHHKKHHIRRRASSTFGLIELVDSSSGEEDEEEAEEADRRRKEARDEEKDVSASNLQAFMGANAAEKLVSTRSRLVFFRETRDSYGRTALLFSGGARMGLYHIGVMKTLIDHNLLPRIVSGSSAGSIVTAVIGCLTLSEIQHVAFDPKRMNRRFFGRSDSLDEGLQLMFRGEPLPEKMQAALRSRPTAQEGSNSLLGALLLLLLSTFPSPYSSYEPLLRKLLPRMQQTNQLLDIRVLGQAIQHLVGDMTFLEAFEKTGRVINITATPFGGDRQVPLLLNYLSSPHVTVASACMASCCIPGVFSPVPLVAKTVDGSFKEYSPAGLRWIDGSIESDLPMTRLKELFNINHFIVSQVEPWARFFAPADDGELDDLPYRDKSTLQVLGRLVRFCREQVGLLLEKWSQVGLHGVLSLGLGKVLGAIVQKYDGDITMYPHSYARDIFTLLQNPDESQYMEAILEGERMVWPKLRRIRRQCMVEFMMDDCIDALIARIEKLEKDVAIQVRQGRAPVDAVSSMRRKSFATMHHQHHLLTEQKDDAVRAPSRISEESEEADVLSEPDDLYGRPTFQSTLDARRPSALEVREIQTRLMSRMYSVSEFTQSSDETDENRSIPPTAGSLPTAVSEPTATTPADDDDAL